MVIYPSKNNFSLFLDQVKTILENPDHKVSKNEIEKLSEEVRNDK